MDQETLDTLADIKDRIVDRIHASEEELAAAAEVEKHWVHWVKIIFIVGKIGIVIVMLLFAIRMYLKKYQKCTVIPVMLFALIIALALLIVLDMTETYIAGFYILCFMSNYCSFVGFYYILKNLPGAPGAKLKKETRWYFITMNALYGISLLLGFFPRFGPTCTSEKVYPACMNWIADLFILNFIFHCVINFRKGFYFSEGAIVTQEQVDAANASAVDKNGDDEYAKVQTKQLETESSADGSQANLDWTDLERADRLSKKMFKRQMTIYLWFQAALVVCNIAIQLWGRIFVHKNHFLGCTDGGKQWLYTTLTGELFVAAHMMIIISTSVMVEAALYKVPKKLGWFENTTKELDLADNYPEAKDSKIDEKDNDFKAIN